MPLTIPMTLAVPDFDDDVTVGTVLDALNTAISRAYGPNNEERFSRGWDLKPDDKWFQTRQRWMLVFFVEGGSEGHYVHVDTMNGYDHITPATAGTARHLFMMKTFNGYDRAQEIQKIAQFILTQGTGR